MVTTEWLLLITEYQAGFVQILEKCGKSWNLM